MAYNHIIFCQWRPNRFPKVHIKYINAPYFLFMKDCCYIKPRIFPNDVLQLQTVIIHGKGGYRIIEYSLVARLFNWCGYKIHEVIKHATRNWPQHGKCMIVSFLHKCFVSIIAIKVKADVWLEYRCWYACQSMALYLILRCVSCYYSFPSIFKKGTYGIWV